MYIEALGCGTSSSHVKLIYVIARIRTYEQGMFVV